MGSGPTRPMPTEAGILAFHERCEAFYPADAVNASVAQQRRWYDALCAEFDAPSPEGLTRRDDLVAGRIAIRRYRPAEVASETRVFYIHGGGFVVGSLESHDAICAELADGARVELVSADYRLAPEHVWPAAFEDCYDVMEALLADRRPLVVAGDSAGGNLCAGIVLKAKAEGLSGIAGQVLIYPGLGGDLTRGSYLEMAAAPLLSTADVNYYRDVLKAPADEPFAHPLRAANLSGLPPAYVSGAHFDPLRDDARAYAARLAQAGVDVTYREEPQMVHSWLRARHMSPGAREGFGHLVRGVAGLAGTCPSPRV
ncbi:alpha/beta hydrolase [Sinorhizobium medicae]|uniref:alpha/beta hydrolase n=1 Tax=Sinorhizobium medicae TaxID=110321 RepID=UPI000FD86E2E|nr:alpha/beta hydrolase [Sinorhizobium medicae]RVJ73380.1 alpha/beta hydrolase [Sinorhizobium medicae]